MENNKAEFPDNLYQTPDNWGSNTFYLTAEQVDEMVNDLDKIDGFDVDPEACVDLDLVRQINEDTALYDGDWHHDGGRFRNERRYGLLIRRDGDKYDLVEYFDTSDDYEED